jgi:hypothetical protein
MRSLSNVFLSVVFFAILTTFADACVLNGPRYQLASDTVRWSLELSEGESCLRGVRFNNVVVDKLIIVSAPQTGHITLHGTGFSYNVAKNFWGRDFFSLMVSGAINKVPGSSTIEVEVSVSNADGSRRFSTMKPSQPSPAGSAASLPSSPLPINDLCGLANDVAANSAPTTNLCSTGSASVVSGDGPWRWSCTSGNGGTTAQCSAPVRAASWVQKPGPSVDLFTNPYYTCVNNYYISASGSDTNNGSSDSPWLTLRHADSTPRAPGDCINVAPGTYDGLTVTRGGNAAKATGYVVYRCQTMDACIINGNAGHSGSEAVDFDFSHASASQPNTVNYVQFDGFVLVGKPPAAQGYGVGFNVYNGDNSNKVASHHVWLLNSIVHGFGQGGIAFCCGEYQYSIHNTSYGNANTQCDAQGSGLAINISHTIPGYTPTVDDKTNPNSLLGPTWEKGDGTFFRIVFEYNVTYNNALTRCGTISKPFDTDGNGIIFDTNAGFAGNSTNYTAPMLAAFNVTYNNGGGGVHVFRSSNVTVANNTCFNNYLDPFMQGSARACIDDSEGSGSTFINNIAVAIPATVSSCGYFVAPYTMWNNSVIGDPQAGQATDTFGNNLTDTIGTSCQGEIHVDNGDNYSATSNKESTNPMWVDVGNTSPGMENTSSGGINFALRPGSPAIGYGLAEAYLPPQSVDVGACSSSVTICP